MVGLGTLALTSLAASDKQTLLEKLQPQQRVAVVLALIGIALLGVLLVTIIMLAGRWARHPAPRRPPRTSASSGAPTSSGENPATPDDAAPGETLPGRPTSSDTLDDRRGGGD